MGCCLCHHRRAPTAEAPAAAAGVAGAPGPQLPPGTAQVVAQLDALTSVRRLPKKRKPGQPAPSSHAEALSAPRYRFGVRIQLIGHLKAQGETVQMRRALPAVKLAFLSLRLLWRTQRNFEDWLLKHLKSLRDL